MEGSGPAKRGIVPPVIIGGNGKSIIHMVISGESIHLKAFNYRGFAEGMSNRIVDFTK